MLGIEEWRAVNRGVVFITTHKKRDGSYVNDEARILSVSIKNF